MEEIGLQENPSKNSENYKYEEAEVTYFIQANEWPNWKGAVEDIICQFFTKKRN